MVKLHEIKSNFDSILKQYGHYIYLQRRLPDDECGANYSDDLETILVRYNENLRQTNVQEEHTEGVVNTSERTYYFRSEVKPFEGDRIYEYDARVKQTVWTLDTVTPMRGVGGQIEYYSAGATRIRPN